MANLPADRRTDHDRGCQGRQYTCSCGYDDERDKEIEQLRLDLAQQALNGQTVMEQQKEIERLEAGFTQIKARYIDGVGRNEAANQCSAALVEIACKFVGAHLPDDVGGGEPLVPVIECVHCHKKFLTLEVGLDHEEHCRPRPSVTRRTE